MYASTFGLPDVVQVLLDYKVDLHLVAKVIFHSRITIFFYDSTCYYTNSRFQDGMTALQRAVDRRKKGIVRMLQKEITWQRRVEFARVINQLIKMPASTEDKTKSVLQVLQCMDLHRFIGSFL